MRITKLKLHGYKNLKISLEHQSDSIALIGNNGSGKSNVLEALSIIFKSLYKNENNVPFDYEIEYSIGGSNQVKVQKKASQIKSFLNGKTQIYIKDFLPKRVIAIYSGEDDRLWNKCYKPFYDDFIKNINKANREGTATGEMPQMLYLNKFYWHISLLALVVSDALDTQRFVKETLGINTIDKIKFDFNTNIDYKSFTPSPITAFLQLIDNEGSEYTIEEFKRIISGSDLSASLPMTFSDSYNADDIFRLLYWSFTDKNGKIISDVKIIFNDGLTIEDLSEGEKKLLLVKAAFEYASQEDSLFILDEPDSHVHLINKKLIIGLLDDYKANRQIILTTHSPKVTECFKEENVYQLRKGKLEDKNKRDIIKDLFGDELDWFGAETLFSKNTPLLLVEGKGDIQYIKRAILLFKDEYPQLQNLQILPSGGSSSAKPLYDELRPTLAKDKKVIVLFDRDDAGKEGMKSFGVIWDNTSSKKGKEDTTTYKTEISTYCLMLPKTDDFESNEFLVEDYFLKETRNKFITESLTDITSFKEVPKDLRQCVKERFSKEFTNFGVEEFVNFKVLLNKLNSIVTPIVTEIFFIDNGRIEAEGYFHPLDTSISVMKGSQILKEEKQSCPSISLRERNKCKNKSLFADDGDYYTLEENVFFKTPNSAAGFVLGYSANGWDKWKNANGLPLKECYAREIKAEEIENLLDEEQEKVEVKEEAKQTLKTQQTPGTKTKQTVFFEPSLSIPDFQLHFWEGFSEYLQNKSDLPPRKPRAQHWYDTSIGSSEAFLSSVIIIRKSRLRVSIYITNNKELFKSILSHKSEIETKYGLKFIWNNKPEKKASLISIEKRVNYLINTIGNEEKSYKWLLESLLMMKNIFHTYKNK
nr:DUF4268 domain-containing protein [uncultured Draconibacterium sp.]